MKIYIQIGRTPRTYKVNASLKQPKNPLHNNGQGRWREYHPTVTFAINVNLPVGTFKLGEKIVADINLENEQLRTNDFEVEVDDKP